MNIEKFKEVQPVFGNEERRLVNNDDSDHTKIRGQSVRVPHNDIVKFDVGSMTPEEIEVKTSRPTSESSSKELNLYNSTQLFILILAQLLSACLRSSV